MSSRHPNFGVHVGGTYNVRGRLSAAEIKTFQQDINLGNTAAGATIPVVYGPAPVNGDVIAKGFIGSPQELVVAVAWGFGQFHQIKKTFINGVDVSTLSGVQVHHYRGTTYQAADAWLTSAVASYTDTLILNKPAGNIGIAYSVFRVPASVVGSSPRFQAIVEGSLVYDPRSSSTGDPFYDDVGFSVDFTTGTDASTNAHTVTLSGDAATSGGWLVLDGAGDYASIPDHGSTEFSSTAWTAEIRCTTTSVSGTDYLLTKSSGSSPDLGFELYRSGADLGLRLSSDGLTNDIQTGVIDTSTFAVASPETEVVIVVEWDGTYYRVWVDGSEVWSLESSTGIYDNGQDWQIGARGGVSSTAWTGRIRGARYTAGNIRYGGNHTVTNSPFPDSGTYQTGYVYSDNPALCWGDLVTNPYYGLGTTASGLSDAADWCDEALRTAVPRAKISLPIYTPRKTEKWMDYVCAQAHCFWFHDGSGAKIVADRPIGETNPSGRNYVPDPDFDTDSWTAGGGWSHGIKYVTTEGGDPVVTESGDPVITEDSVPGTYCHTPTSPQAEGSLSKAVVGLDPNSEHVITIVVDSISTGTISVEFDGTEVIAGQSSAGTYTATVTPTASSPEPLLEAVTTDSDACISHLSIKRKYWLEETWVKDSLVLRGLPTNDTPTKVSVRYRESSDTDINWQEKVVSVTLPEASSGDVPLVETTIPMESIYRADEATDKAESRLLRMQNRVQVSWVSTDIGLAYQRGTVVQVRSAMRGVDILVLVESVEMQSPGRYKVTGTRYSDDHYPAEIALGAGVIPVGTITMNDSATIPTGWAAWNSANGRYIRAWDDTVSPEMVAGDIGGAATYAGFSGNTSTNGAHNGDDGTQFDIYDTVSGSALASLDKVSGDVGGHNHTYSTGSIDPELYTRETVLMQKTGSPSSSFPASALVFGRPTLSVPNLVRSLGYAGRLIKAASAPANSGVTSKTVQVTTGATDDSHSHREIDTSPLDSRSYAGSGTTQVYTPESGGSSHTHDAAITITRNPKRKCLALYAGTSSYTVGVGTIVMWEGALTGSPEPFPGWQLADGTNGTVDLRGYFIEVAASGNEEVAAGDNTLSISATSDSKSHEHRGTSVFVNATTREAGHSNNISHSHTISDSDSYTPPYYGLYFLEYVGT